jgi:Dienelactone hydrolase family
MTRRSTLLAAILLTCLRANAATVSFPSSPGEGTGYLALPQATGKHPALIVIQEWWGLNDWIRGQADRFAGQGYVALAPDLYRGKSKADPQLAHELSRGLPEDRALADLEAAFRSADVRAPMNPNNTGGYVKMAADDAWSRIDAFLAKDASRVVIRFQTLDSNGDRVA